MFKIFKKISKENKMENYLLKNKNKWLSAWDIAMCCKTLHHQELLRRLRKKYTIENKCEWENGIKNSFYKLIK